MKRVINKDYWVFGQDIDNIIFNFDKLGEEYGNQKRNTLKLFELEDFTLNIKSFRVPNFINQIAYKFFRKSKARRSYEHAIRLKELGIGTPQPIAYYEFPNTFLFKKSFYVSKQIQSDLTFRELTTDLQYPEHEIILRAFIRFTYKLHEKGVHFLDHSPGNTLIKKEENGYSFYLVDLNRMEFKEMNLRDRVKNLGRLTIQDTLVKVMSDEYAKLSNKSYDKIYNMLWGYINTFQNNMKRRKTLKKKLLFRS